jgi:hypothetical protein
VSRTSGARTLRVVEFDWSISATVDLPVLDDRGLWVCRTRIPKSQIDFPMNDYDSLGALLSGLQIVALEWFATEKYMEVSLSGNKGIPLWHPVETEGFWRPGRAQQSIERVADPTVAVRDYVLLAERSYFDADDPEGGVLVHSRICGSPEQPTRCRVELITTTPPAATYHYEVTGDDSMEALEQALLTASVRLEFVLERLGGPSPGSLRWKSGAKVYRGAGLPAFPDVPYSEVERIDN